MGFILADYELDLEVMAGWSLPAVGDYTLKFKTSFERATFVARCEDKCADHGRQDKPWNRAVGMTREFSAKQTVKE